MTDKPVLGQEIAVIESGIDITRGFFGSLLQPYDPVLAGRGGSDLRIYEGVLSDPEVASCLAQRRLAVTRAEWKMDAASDSAIDKANAEFQTKQLNRIGWDNVTTKMHFGVFYGYSVAEQIYMRDGKNIGLKAVKVRNRRRFKFDKDAQLRMLTQSQMTEGVLCPPPYFWHFATGSDNDDEPYGTGLAHWLYWPVLFKRQGMKFWLQFLDKMAIGTAVGKYGPNANAAEKAVLLAAASALAGGAAAVTMPNDMQVELLNAARAGTPDYKTLQDHMNATIQKVILGQTASTQGTAGKLGNDDLQGDVRADIIKADADLICESWNLGPARWLTEWNFPGAEPPRVSRMVEPPEDLTEAAKRDTQIKGLGFKPSLKYVQQTYGTEWTEDPNANRGPPPGAPGADPAAAFAEATSTADPAARMADRMSKAIAPIGGDWIDKIRAAGSAATSLQDLRDRISSIAPELTLDQYSNAMAEGLAAAALAGRYEVLQEIGGANA